MGHTVNQQTLSRVAGRTGDLGLSTRSVDKFVGNNWPWGAGTGIDRIGQKVIIRKNYLDQLITFISNLE